MSSDALTETAYGLSVRCRLPFQQAVERTKEALAKEGFGVLTEIDVPATFKKKLGIDFRPYLILGACNPPLAHRALSAELELGLLLPCNVVVYASDTPGECVVAAMDPVAALSLAANENIRPIAHEVRGRLERVLADVKR